MWWNILKPIITLSTISAIFAFSFSDGGISFLKVFIITSVVQIFIHNIYKSFVFLSAERIKNERIREFSKQGMDVVCPCYMEKKMFVPIELNTTNTFNCIECKKDCIVQITAKTFNKTDIIDLDVADAALIEVYKKLQNAP
jgi:hypothetical protein